MIQDMYIPKVWLVRIKRSGYLFISDKTLREMNRTLLEIYLKENKLYMTESRGGVFIREEKKVTS